MLWTWIFGDPKIEPKIKIDEKPKIVIIGAGLAGLTVAYRLNKNGLPVEVYEAKNRVGGRVHTILVENFDHEYSEVELGGQNIKDGGEAKHMLSLASELNIELIENCNKYLFVFYDGEKLQDVKTILNEHDFNLEEFKNILSMHSHQSIQDVLDKVFEKNSILNRFFTFRLSAYEGSPPNLLSPYHNIKTLESVILGHFLHAKHNQDYSVKSVTLKGGNATLPYKIASQLQNHIHLNMALKKIKMQSNQIEIGFQDGTSVLCDKLILAIPCSVYDDIEIDEHIIPSPILKEIKSVQYGCNGKIIIPTKDKVETYDNIVNDNMVAFPNADRKVLVLFFEGASGKNLLRNLSNLFHEALQVISLRMKGICQTFAKIPVIAKEEQWTKYSEPVVKSWQEDPYAKGAYSNFGVNLGKKFGEKTLVKNTEFKKMFRPLSDDKIFFAGEHTTILDEIGTMEAAVESGERISKYIIENIGI